MAVGKYVVEVSGNEYYYPTTKEMNFLNEEDQQCMKVYIGLRPKTDIETEFEFFD